MGKGGEGAETGYGDAIFFSWGKYWNVCRKEESVFLGQLMEVPGGARRVRGVSGVCWGGAPR